MSLHNRLKRVIGLCMGLTAVTGISCGVSLGVTVYDQSRVTGKFFQTNQLLYQQVNAHSEYRSSIRSFEQTGDEEQLQVFRQATSNDDRIYYSLAQLLENDQELLPLLNQTYSLSRQWRQKYGEVRIKQVVDDGPSLVDSPLVVESTQEFNNVASSRENLMSAALTERKSAIDRLKFSTALLAGMIALTLLLFVGCLAFLWRSLRVLVTQPLQQLGSEVAIVETGDLQHQITTQGPEDIRELGENIDKMRKQIVTQYSLAVHSQHIAEESKSVIEKQAVELERSNRDLEQFAYVASHDLQEPLRKVSSFCRLIKERYSDKLDDKGVQYIDFAVDGAQRMQGLISDLLAFSRAGRNHSRWENVDLNQCLKQAMNVLERELTESQAVLSWDHLPTIHGEKSLLVQFFQNIISNAIKFRSQAPPVIHIAVKQITPRQEQPYWQMSCTDNGIGIDPEFHEKVFVIFQRLHGKTEYSGSGIGLALCKKIVDYHGGAMWLHTERNSSRRDLPVPRQSPEGHVAPTVPASSLRPSASIGAQICWTFPALITTASRGGDTSNLLDAAPPSKSH